MKSSKWGEIYQNQASALPAQNHPRRWIAAVLLLVLGVSVLSGCGLVNRRHKDLAGVVNPGDQPDKILFEKAVHEIDHGRYDVGRLTLQTLINTYPDSEYLAKSKLAISDSYYREGGVSGLTEAIAEYKDFITFFPTAPEAPEAQFRVGMAHFHMMGKPDRDLAEARLAQVELKAFLLKYPDSPLLPQVKGRLRQIQEVLGTGNYAIGQFYYAKGALPAAEARFKEISDQYPDFSEADQALYYLGQTLEKERRPKEAVPYYSRVLTSYPLSPAAEDAKDRLAELHAPVPRASKAVMARARADALHRPQRDLMSRLTGMISSAPDLSATRHGPALLGKQPAAIEAKTQQPAPSPGNAIAVRQVTDESLTAGQPIDLKPAATDPGAPNPAAAANPQQGTSSSNQADLPRKKKKSKFGVLKKLDPF